MLRDRTYLGARTHFQMEPNPGGGHTGLDPECMSHLIESTADGLWLDMPHYPNKADPQLPRDRMRSFLHGWFARNFAPPESHTN